MSKDKKQAAHESNQARYERQAAEINETLTKEEQKALSALADAGWLVLIHPRVEDSTTGVGMRSPNSKGRYRIGLVKERFQR